MLETTRVLCICATTDDAHPSRLGRLQESAVAGDGTIVMLESYPPQVMLQGGFGDVLFEATAGTFSGNTGCGDSRATTSGDRSVTFNPPDSNVYTIRAVYASAHGAVNVVEMSVGSAASGCPEDLVKHSQHRCRVYRFRGRAADQMALPCNRRTPMVSSMSMICSPCSPVRL